MPPIDNFHLVALTCTFLVQKREIEQQQEITIMAIKIARNQKFGHKYNAPIRKWITGQKYIPYSEVLPGRHCEN